VSSKADLPPTFTITIPHNRIFTYYFSEEFELDGERWKLIYDGKGNDLCARILSIKAFKGEGSVSCQASIRLVSPDPNSTIFSLRHTSDIPQLNPNRLHSVEWMDITRLNENKSFVGFTHFAPLASIPLYLHQDECVRFLVSAKVQDDPTLYASNQSVPSLLSIPPVPPVPSIQFVSVSTPAPSISTPGSLPSVSTPIPTTFLSAPPTKQSVLNLTLSIIYLVMFVMSFHQSVKVSSAPRPLTLVDQRKAILRQFCNSLPNVYRCNLIGMIFIVGINVCVTILRYFIENLTFYLIFMTDLFCFVGYTTVGQAPINSNANLAYSP
jgi:hypothetical protein